MRNTQEDSEPGLRLIRQGWKVLPTQARTAFGVGVRKYYTHSRRIRLSSRHRKAEVLISALLRSSVSRGSDSHLGCHSLPLPLRILRSYARQNKKVHCLWQWTFLFGRGRRIRTRDPRFWSGSKGLRSLDFPRFFARFSAFFSQDRVA